MEVDCSDSGHDGTEDVAISTPTQVTDESRAEAIQSKQPAKSGEGQSKRSKKRKKKKASNDLNDPMKILGSVLNQSSFERPNLSQHIDQLYNSEPYKSMMKAELATTSYFSTVDETFCDEPDANVGILPLNIHGTVNIGPSAITHMTCINKLPDKRPKRNKGARKKSKRYTSSNTMRASRDTSSQ